MELCVVGSGYVGLVVGVCMADLGFRVTCCDREHDKIDALRAGRVPIYEPGLEPILRRNQATGRLSFSTDTGAVIERADVVYIAVGTPALRRCSFIVGLSRQRKVVSTLVPGMPRISRTLAAVMTCASTTASRRSILTRP